MELKQFINKMQQSSGLRSMLPMHQGMLYPYFTITNGRLCAHFLTHASKIIPEGLVIYPPEYHIVSCYPEGDIRCIRDLKYDPAFASIDYSQTALLEKKSPAERETAKQNLQKLAELSDCILSQWEQTGDADLAGYHSQLAQVLTQQQYQMYLEVTGRE